MMKKICAIMALLLAFVSQLPADALAAHSPFYEMIVNENIAKRQVEIDPTQYLDADNEQFKALSDAITAGITQDQAKVKAIHDWMCDNMYYDYDIYEQQDSDQIVYTEATAWRLTNMSLYDHLMQYKRGVCSYYATIFTELVRAQEIPCMTVRGYTVGGGVVDIANDMAEDSDKWTSTDYTSDVANHDWNEVYLDGRWVIIDVTWDCLNRYQNGEYSQVQRLDTYFDIDDRMLAKDHRILSYGRGKHTEQTTYLAPFTDVTTADYFYKPVKWALANKITAGTSATTFSPNEPCTNGQTLAFLWKAADAPIVQTNDIFTQRYTSDPYYPAIAWAYTQSILQRSDDFAPDAPCTRSQVIHWLWRAAHSPQVEQRLTFDDVSDDAPYSTAIAWALTNDITAGTSVGTFSPTDTCTRGQVMSFLYNMSLIAQ